MLKNCSTLTAFPQILLAAHFLRVLKIHQQFFHFWCPKRWELLWPEKRRQKVRALIHTNATKYYLTNFKRIGRVCSKLALLRLSITYGLWTSTPANDLRILLTQKNTETDKEDRNPPITAHEHDFLTLLSQTFCFLRGPLQWLTAVKSVTIDCILNFRVRMLLKGAVN